MSGKGAVVFRVSGTPVPKQSFRVDARTGRVRGFRAGRVSAWQDAVAGMGMVAMVGQEPLGGDLAVWLDFELPTRRRLDLDNLSKGCLDALNGVCWRDDRQIVELHLRKRVGKQPGVLVRVEARERDGGAAR